MKTKTTHVHLLLAAALFAGVVLYPATSSPSMLPPSPDPEEVALIEELTSWVNARPLADGRFRAVGEEDLIAAMRSLPESFELFRSFHGSEASRRVLNSLDYGEAIHRAAERWELDALLLAAVVEAESNFNPRVISPAGAYGLAQVMPDTAHSFGAYELLDPDTNLDIGARYLAWCLELYDGNLELALAAYNAGPGNVRRYGGVPPFPETRAYLRKVLDLYVGHHQDLWHGAEVGALLVRENEGPRRGIATG